MGGTAPANQLRLSFTGSADSGPAAGSGAGRNSPGRLGAERATAAPMPNHTKRRIIQNYERFAVGFPYPAHAFVVLMERSLGVRRRRAPVADWEQRASRDA